MRRLSVVAAFAALAVSLALAATAFGSEANEACLECHAAPGAGQDFSVSVDMAKCGGCHWVEKHYFDATHLEQALPDYMTKDCSVCHRWEFQYPPRPDLVGYPQTNTAYGWFQSEGSLQLSAQEIHDAHVNGSWPKVQSQCGSCHEKAACGACHTGPAVPHEDHTLSGESTAEVTTEIGKAYGDTTPDTFIYSYRPDQNNDGAATLYAGQTSYGEERFLITFPLSESGDDDVVSATLRLTRSAGEARTLRAYRLRRGDWSSSSATWNRYAAGGPWGTAGAKSDTQDFHPTPFAESATGEFDVTELVAAARAAGEDRLDLLVVDPAPERRKYCGFYSSATTIASRAPRLTVVSSELTSEYAYPPVTYTVCEGSSPGQEMQSITRQEVSTCVNPACHDLADASSAAFVPTCASCHTDVGDSHEGAHLAELTDPLAGSWPAIGDSAAYNPAYAYSFACEDCHDPMLTVEHARATSTSASAGCDACHPSPRDTLSPWGKTCVQSGCHPSGSGQEQHAGLATAHAISQAEIDAGCSQRTVATPYRYACHYRDLVQEHNRTILVREGPRVLETLSVTCVGCHSSDAFEALEGGWDGSCGACHPGNHSDQSGTRYAEVYDKHANPGGFYDNGGGYSGSNTMDVHGWIGDYPGFPTRMSGCGFTTCHTAGYLGGGYPYPSSSCSSCHGPSIVVPDAYEGAYAWYSDQWVDYEPLETALTLDLSATALPAGSSLDFKTWYDIEADWDYGYVEISTDGGTEWTSLPGSITTEDDPNGVNLGNGITGGTNGAWVDAHFDLGAYAGRSVLLRLRYSCDSFVYGIGWMADSISVGPAGAPVFTDDVETLAPEWTVEADPGTGAGWSRHSSAP